MQALANTPPTRCRARLTAKLSELFGCDVRSLALLRVGLGIAVLADVATRAVDLRLFYTDAGVCPRDLLLAAEGREVLLSAHYWASAAPWMQACLFAVTAAAAVALALGWRTRLATLACWYLVASVQIRQPMVYMGGDSILRLLLFWSLFLPLGARFSIDAHQGRVAARADRVLSVGTAAILLQVCLVYWMTGLLKTGPLWWNGKAIYYALHNERATALGTWLLGYPGVLEWLTYGTLALERLGPCLAFVPVGTAWCRMATIALFWAFHAGLATTMNIGLFPLFAMVGWLAFLPSRFWERARAPSTISIDGLRGWRARLASIGAAACLIYVVVLLAQGARYIPRVLPSVAVQVGTALRLNQTWAMFAPDVQREAWTYRVRTVRFDGEIVEVPIGNNFRTLRYARMAALAVTTRDPHSGSVERLLRLACESDAAAETASFVERSASLTDHGPEHPRSVALVTVRCLASR